MATRQTPQMRVYLFPDLRPAGVPFTRKHLTTLEAREPPEFPRRFRIGENTVGWLATEVDQWVEDKIRDRGGLSRRLSAA
jgi:prophage regulatory protein